MAQLIGEVKWFNNMKGYGFLGYEGGPDVFIHYSAIDVAGYKTLNAGDQVSFAIVTGESGKLQADKVTRLNDPQPGAPSIAPAASMRHLHDFSSSRSGEIRTHNRRSHRA